MIAKRRSAATLISYLTPPVAHAGLYRGLVDLKASIDRWRKLAPEDLREAVSLVEMIQAQAATLDFAEIQAVLKQYLDWLAAHPELLAKDRDPAFAGAASVSAEVEVGV